MKTNRKKKKKKGSRKTKLTDIEPKSISKSDPELKSTGKRKEKTRYPDEKKVIDTKPKKDKQGFAFVSTSVQFLRDAKIELKKVKWPTRKELLASTVMVLILVIAVAFYLGIIDIFLNMIIKRL